ncbi:MAG TPA: RHS repeat-associated core domain-containing protein [Candidatus Angelobacter sp.]
MRPAAFSGAAFSGAAFSGTPLAGAPLAGPTLFETPTSNLSLLLGSPLKSVLGPNFMFQSGGPAALAVFVGYADDLRANPNFPVPWQGSPNTTFIGAGPSFDSGAIRLDNNSNSPIQINDVFVTVPGWTAAGSFDSNGNGIADLWGSFTIAPNSTFILTQTGEFNLDTSDVGLTGCGNTIPDGQAPFPTVKITINGVATAFNDTGHVLDTGGFDLACRGNESLQWRLIGTSGIQNTTGHVTLTPPTSVQAASTPYTAIAQVTDAGNQPTPNVVVGFLVLSGPNAGKSGTGTTDSQGNATFTYASTLAGTDILQATVTNSIGGSIQSNQVTSTWTSADPCPAPVTPPGPSTTSLNLVSAGAGEFNDPLTLAAQLTDGNGNPLSGRSLSFAFASQTFQATTDGNGIGTVNFGPAPAPGATPLTVNYAGETNFQSAQLNSSINIGKEETAIHYTGGVLLGTAVPQPVSAALTDPQSGLPIANETITFRVGTVQAQTVTNAQGIASTTLTLGPSQASGPNAIVVSFAGDSLYKPSLTATQVTVYLSTSFVAWGGNAGGLHLGQDVNFWGHSWTNQVTGGNFTGNPSFKGFADPVNQVHVCEASAGNGGPLDDRCWSSKPGQSFPPPISLPAFIEVIISTAITKQGSEVFGNIAAAAVCQVDSNPPYGPDPGHPGFCKLVAVVEDGGNIFPTPPALTATQAQPTTVLPAQNFTVTTTITNSSTSVADSVVVNESFDGVTPATGTQTISSILNGAQKTASFQETTPAIPLRQSTESSVDYQARLASVDGRLFTSTGSISFTDAFGQPFLPIPVSSFSRLQIPELTLGISGPSCVGPGSKIPYKVTVGNIGEADAKNVTILMVFPDGSTGTATIATIPAGGSVSTTFNFVVPAITAKQPNESDQQYLARLALIDGSQLTAVAKVNWQDANGNDYGQIDQQFISTTERVPIITVTPTGPATLLPGQKATLNYAVQNIGGGNASQVVLKITNPDGSITSIPPFALQGGQATAVSSTFTVPVVPAKGAGETDAAYQARLTALENSKLNFTGNLTWLDAAANSYGPTSPAFQSTEILPVLTVDLAGPANLTSGENSNYHLKITNIGHADAASFTAPVKLPDGSVVNPFPPSGLVVGATAQIFVPFSVPKTQPDGQVSATATLNWSDANTNAYGPQSATVTSANVRPNQPPVVNAGPNQTITLPTNSVILNGTVTDDGKPVGAVLTIQWSVVSGPGSVTFSAPNLPVSQATFVTPGVYVLQLSANDTQFTTTSNITITVLANGNLPPVVNAGPDQTTDLFGIATFNGSVTDDGLPPGAPLTSAWKLLSGPGVVIFSSPSTPHTFATASATGQYVLQLSGNDTVFTTASNVNLTVNPPVIPNNNLPPVVNAGPNQTIVLPTNTVTLNGSVTDDGLPVGGTLTQFWTAVSSPGTVTFGNSLSPVTTATFSSAGVYVLRLTASDSELSSSADTTVTVNTGAGRLVGNIEVCYFCDLDLGFGKFQDGPTFIFHNTDTQDITNGVFKIGPSDGFTDSYNVGTIKAGGTVLVAPGLTNDGGTGHTFFAFTGFIRDTSDVGPDDNNVQFEFTGQQGSVTVDTGVFTPATSLTPSLDHVVSSINFLGGPNGADGPCNNCYDNIITNLIAGTVANTPLLKITKTHSGNFATGQQNAAYTLTVSNASTTTATSGTVTVSDFVPPGMTLASASGTNWTCTAGVCSRSDVLAAEASYPAITVSVNVASNATSPQVNIASVAGGGSPSALTSDATTITGAAKFPVVNAGGPQSINLPTNTVTLNGSGNSDTGTLSFTWTKLSGPDTVTFSSPNSAVTQATFSAVGSYLLQLSGTDGTNTAISNTTVTVNPSVNQPPVVSAGANQTITLPTNTIILNGTATDDGLPTGSTLTVSWNQVSGPAAVVFATPTKATTQVAFSAAGTYVLRLTASDSHLFSSSDVRVTVNPAPQTLTVSAGPSQTITFPVNKVTMNGSASGGNGPLTLTWSTVSGPGTVTFSSPNSAVTQATFSAPGSYVLQLSAADGTTTVSATAGVAVNPGPPPPLTVSAGPSQTITLPTNTVTLNGSASGGSGPLTLTWSKVSGPGTVTFSSPNTAVTQATFSTFGSYVLKLSATDGTITVSATTGVAVNPVPVAVNAGASQSITLPTNSATLNGSASGGSGPLTISWTEVSGPALVTFGSPSSAVTTVTFSAAGVYVLQLSATDGFSTASATTSVAVNPPPAQPPVVSAGPNQTITLPTNTATLNGSATSSNGPITFAWSEVSGPAAITFSSPNSAVTQATFPVAGTYVLQLSANDTKFTVTATTSVIVNPAPPPPPPPTVSVTLPEGTEITSPTQIIGSVSGGSWQLQYALASADGVGPAPVFTTFASGNTPVNNGLLGTIDPTALLNGNYIIQLVSTDQFGQTSTINSNVDVTRNVKVGDFTLAFKDLEVPVVGLPVRVGRMYDSRDKASSDFGVGWSLTISNVRLQKNGKLGANWIMTENDSGFIPSFCLQPLKPHVVTITFPDNTVYRFQETTSPSCQSVAPIESANLIFVQMPGPARTQGASLQIVGDNSSLVNPPSPGPVDLLDFTTVDDANQTVFQLTTVDGVTYAIDQTLGVTSVTDRNGNQVTIETNGITTSTGKSVAFTRDGQNRITKITDPDGNTLNYSYTAGSDLASFTDRVGNTTTFSYDATHLLTNIVDPRGVQAVKNTYDSSGRLTSTTDGNGNTTTFTHAVATNHETVTDRLGNQTLFEYDDDGNLTRVTDALGGITSYTYDANDNKLTETNALGKTTSYTYDALGDQTSVTDPLGNKTQTTFNSRRQPLTITDPLGRVTTNTYDANGSLLTMQDAVGSVTSYTYNKNGLPASKTDALGNKTTLVYDSNGNLTSQTDALGNTTSYTYDSNGNKLTQAVVRTRSDGTKETLTTQYQYDSSSRLVKTINPDSSTTQVIYDSIGRHTDSVDPLGRKTHYDYDNDEKLTTTTYPDGTKETVTYDADNRQISSTDRAGRATAYTYDPLSRLVKTVYPDNSAVQTVYDAIGQRIKSIDALGNTTLYAYDDAQRYISTTDSLGHLTTFTYDAVNNQISSTDALNRTTKSAYDKMNRRVQTTYPDNTTDSNSFDAVGRRVLKTDQAGKVTQYAYDALGRLISVTDALNQATNYSYDELGNNTKQSDANSHSVSFAYDQMKRRISRTLPLGMTESYTYDATGNLTSRKDFNGRTTTYAYDTMNRLIVKSADPFFTTNGIGAGKVNFTYTAIGLRLSMTDASGTNLYTYDDRDRLLIKATPSGTLTYTYDAAGNILSLASSNPGGASMTYGYDALNRLSSVTDVTGTTAYSYDAVGNLSSFVYPNGITSGYSYDTLNRLTSMQSTCGATGPACGASGKAISSYAYTLGPAGNRLSVAELTGRTVQYSYDSIYRLASEAISSASSQNGTVSYTYDSVGNRAQLTSSVPAIPSGLLNYDVNDRLTTDVYDANGNTINNGGIADTYDFENRLVQHGAVKIVYDGDGNRVAETVAGVTTNYLVADANVTGYAQVVDELQSGTVTRAYTYGLELINERQTIGGTPTASFYEYDGHGSVRFLTSSTGAVTDTYDYDAFGNLLNSTGSTPNNYLFAGQQFDSALGVYYNRARYLDVRTGRFLSMDTREGQIQEPRSLHKYAFSWNDPVNRIDPSGYQSLEEEEEVAADEEILDSEEIEEIENPGKPRPWTLFYVQLPQGITYFSHEFIWAFNTQTEKGWGYHVLVPDPKRVNMVLSQTQVVPGLFLVVPQDQVDRALDWKFEIRTIVPVAALTQGQFLFWNIEAVSLGGICDLQAIGDVVRGDFPYKIPTNTCITWTRSAIALAVSAMLLPF